MNQETTTPQPMGELDRLVGVLFDPKPAFADIAQRPRPWAPLALLSVLSIVFIVLFSQRVGWEQVVRKAIESNPRAMERIPADQREQVIQQQAKVSAVFGYVFSVVGTALAGVILAGFYLFVFNVLAGADVRFGQSFAIVCYALLPRGLLALGAVPLVGAHHASAQRLHVRIERLVGRHDDQLLGACCALDQITNDGVGVLALRRHAHADGCQLLRREIPVQRVAIEDDGGPHALAPAESSDAPHDLPAPVVRPARPAPRTEKIVAVDEVGHRPPVTLELQQPPQEALAIRVALQEELVQFSRVEVDPLTEDAHVDGDAVQVLLLHVVPALRAFHVVQLLEPAALLILLLGGPLLLALLACHARGLDQLLLVLPEPVVLAGLLLLYQGLASGATAV